MPRELTEAEWDARVAKRWQRLIKKEKEHPERMSPLEWTSAYKAEQYYGGPVVPHDPKLPRCDECGRNAAWARKYVNGVNVFVAGAPKFFFEYRCDDCKKALRIPKREWLTIEEAMKTKVYEYLQAREKARRGNKKAALEIEKLSLETWPEETTWLEKPKKR